MPSGKRLVIKKNARYGKLKVIGDAEKKILPSGQKIRMIECLCDCGLLHNVALVHLVRGRSTSCGCQNKTKNGESNSPIHRKWKSMIERCYEDAVDRNVYFKKGIKVCKEWSDYFKFKEWALNNGYKKELQIDRIDNSKGYSPENCRFVTQVVNANNRDNTFFVNYKNKKYPLMILLRNKKIPEVNYASIRTRILRGWNHTDAFDKPIRKGNYVSRNNKH